MKTLSKKERHQKYIDLLNYYEDHTANTWPICPQLMVHLGEFNLELEDYMRYIISELPFKFPEIFLFKPLSVKPDQEWFDDNKERQLVLMFCIEMTKD